MRDVLLYLRTGIFCILGGIAVCLVLAGGRKLGERLYPQSFYLFGRNQKVYSSLQSKRQVWGIAIVAGFLVNIAAGFTVALLVK